jgi:PIN domain nuclease of toxin-antitoxin system
VLLDTHIWIWAAADEPGKLGPKTRRAITKAGAAGTLLVTRDGQILDYAKRTGLVRVHDART